MSDKALHRLDMRISQAQKDRIEALMKRKALTKSAIVNLAIKELADREGVGDNADTR